MKLKFSSIIVFLCILFKYLICYKIETNLLYILLIIIAFAEIIVIYIKGKFYKKELFKILFFFTINVIYVIKYKDVNLLISLMLAITFYDNDKKRFLKEFFISSIIMYSITILFSFLGVKENLLLYRKTENDIKIRNSLGFNHPNEVFLFWLPIAVILKNYYKNNNKINLFIIIVTVILYYFSKSRTGLAIIILLYVFDFINEKNINKLKKIMYFSPIILTILSFILAEKYGNNWSNFINNALSYRPYYWKMIINKYSYFTFFGNSGVDGMYVDNFYIFLIYRMGLYSVLIYYMIYILGLKKIDEKEDLISCIIFLIYGVVEANTLIGSINFTIAILLNRIIFNKNNSEKCEEKKKIYEKNKNFISWNV